MPVNNWGNGLQNDAPRSPEALRLDENATTWLIVAVAGFFVGVMFVTGPIAWYQASRLSESYRAQGLEPSQNANAARIIGMISTILGVIALVTACVIGMATALLVIRQHHH